MGDPHPRTVMHCYVCQAPVTEEHRFCEQCGQPIPWARPADDVLEDFDLEQFNALREEKQRLHRALENIVLKAGEDGVSEPDRGAWAELYERWTHVRDRITQEMERFSPRLEEDRRLQDRRRHEAGADRPDRRQGRDRRRRADRRDPFRIRNPFPRRHPRGGEEETPGR